MFGPVYHGTMNDQTRQLIDREGFKVIIGQAQSGGVSNGYLLDSYWAGIPAPIHHLGFGVYFTTVKSIAKKYAGGSVRGMATYYLDTPDIETINFAVPKTMMNWWLKNGYDYNIKDQSLLFGNQKTSLPAIFAERFRATVAMTDYLKSKYSAVWFKGRTIRSTLDGDQVCVYDPSNIYKIDPSLFKKGDVGSKVVLKVNYDPYGNGKLKIPIGTKGIIIGKENPYEHWKWAEGSEWVYKIKFDKGGTQVGILDKWIDFV